MPKPSGELVATKITMLFPRLVVINSINLYDHMDKYTPTIKGEKGRSAYNPSINVGTCRNNDPVGPFKCPTRQFFNKAVRERSSPLTRANGPKWRVVYDEKMKSARIRKAKGTKRVDG